MERDAVAVVVPRGAVTNGDVAHAVHVNCSAAATVNVLVFCSVAINDEILEHNVCGVYRTQYRECVADAGMVLLLVIVAQSHRVDDHVRRLHTGNGRDCYRPSSIRNVIGDSDAHAWTKLLRVGYCEQSVAVIAVFDEWACNSAALAQNCFAGNATNRHT